MGKATKANENLRPQCGALPFTRGPDGEARVLLVTSRETRRWVIPKGWPMKGLKAWDAASREAYEEAGLVGEVGKRPLGTYTYEKRLKEQDLVTCEVSVFPFKVKRQLEHWPERAEREGRWFTVEEAASMVAEPGLAAIIRSLAKLSHPAAKVA